MGRLFFMGCLSSDSMYPISFVLRSFPEKFPVTSILSLLDFRPDRQSLLQHLLRAGADLAFMWENGVLMVNRQAKPLWQDAVPLITGCRQARRPASPPGSTRPLFFYLRCKAEMPWGHSPENRCPSRVLRLPVIWVWFRVGGCVRRGWIPYGCVRFPCSLPGRPGLVP